MRPDLFDIIKYIKSKDIAIHLCTNGTLLTSENIKKLKESVPNAISVSISAHTSELYDLKWFATHPDAFLLIQNGSFET